MEDIRDMERAKRLHARKPQSASPFKGRGAADNPTPRFEKLSLELEPEDLLPGEERRPGPRTEVYVDHSRSVIARNDSPDIPFGASINPYRGCEHGCSYCYARPTHEYLGLSAGIEFETKIFAKLEAPKLLREELMKRSWMPQEVTLSGVTDPYQPVERKLRITRGCLEVLAEFGNPFSIITKNHLITRDIDILSEMAAKNAAAAFVSITTLDPDLAERIEPRASRPSFRLQAVRELSKAGVPVGVMMAPMIPGLTDHEIPTLLEAARDAGARFTSFVPLRLPGAVSVVFEDWLSRVFPERKDKVLNRVRGMRGGKLNDPRFGNRMRGEGPYVEQIRKLFKLQARKLGFNREKLILNKDEFRRPGEQLSLL